MSHSSLRLPTSLAVIFGSFNLGLYVAIQGPTLMDLIDILHINNDTMSYSLAFASLAYSVGGLLSGFLFNYVNRPLLIAAFFIIFGVSNIITPFIGNFMIFSVITVFKMMCAGGTDCGANVWILEIWPGKDAWLQALHFTFAVGCALGPLIVEPFLSADTRETDGDKSILGISGKTSGTTIINDQNTESHIHIPFGVSGGSSILAALLIIYLHILSERRKYQDAKLRAKQQAAAGENILITSGAQHPAAIEAGLVADHLELCELEQAVKEKQQLESQLQLQSATAGNKQSRVLEQTGCNNNNSNNNNHNKDTTTINMPDNQQQQAPQNPSALPSSPPPPPPPEQQQQHQQQQQQLQIVANNKMLLLSKEDPTAAVATVAGNPEIPSSNNLQIAIIPPLVPSDKIKFTSKVKENQVGRPPYYVMVAVALAAMSLSFYCGIEITSMNYLATFAVNIDLQLPKSTAAYMSSALTISFAVGRAFGIFMAARMRPHKLFYLCAAIMVIGNILMLLFANTAETLLWYSICLFGVGCGPMFPAIVSFYDYKISKVTNTVSGIFISGSMFNVALNSLIIGHHIIDNALILLFCNLVGSILLLILFGTLHLLTKLKTSQRVRKYKLNQQKLLAAAAAAAQAQAQAQIQTQTQTQSQTQTQTQVPSKEAEAQAETDTQEPQAEAPKV